jgi:hypothetical protein
MFGTWILNMNTRMCNLTLVGIGVIIWTIWLSRNDIAFDKKISSILYAGYLQGDTLDKNMVTVPKGGGTQAIARCLPYFGNSNNEDLCKTWMTV